MTRTNLPPNEPVRGADRPMGGGDGDARLEEVAHEKHALAAEEPAAEEPAAEEPAEKDEA